MKEINNIANNWKLSLTTILISVGIFCYFRFAHRQAQQNSITVIESLLRNESLVANSYALSKSILDLEYLGLVSCSVVYDRDEKNQPFYDTTGNSKCSKNNIVRFFEEVSIELKAINGINYNIVFQFPIQWQTYALELMSYLLLILIITIYKRIRKENDLKLEMARALITQSKQVSHDIRSPLTVLNLITSTLTDMPEDQRIAMRSATGRINDIANQLLQKSQVVHNLSALEKTEISTTAINNDSISSGLTIELLPAIIDMLVSEKRIQFRERSGITIETDFEESYGAFAKINSTEFKRVISNLINNSIEAMKKPGGRIVVTVKNFESKTVVAVRDNGSGIPAPILELLGQQGVSFGKDGTESGSGLGIYHAKKTIESFDGKFVINSREGLGTEIRMDFPKCQTPEWFVPKLNLKQSHIIVALDDEISILEIWKQRIRSLNDQSINLITFTSSNELIEWLRNNRDLATDKILYLMDYELLGQNTNGLDLIEKYSLNDKAVLVTSRYEESFIKDRCTSLKVKQIPKSMAQFVPIELTDS
jgi:signal transduction histidine kinase